MGAPVWVLSVDLQTKTATFASGMNDAAKSARGAFNEIKSGASSAGRETGASMTEARHGVRLLAEDFGVRMPRALSTFVASIGPIGAAMEAAFPFLAIIALAGIFVDHLKKVKEEGRQLTESQERFATVTANTYRGLEDKLLQAGIKTDELNKDHLAALKKQLELIDHQSLEDLVKEFDIVAKAADAVFANLHASWYQFGTGSRGAQNALTQFKTEYDKLLAMGKDKEAGDLLAGTLHSAERVLEMQKQAEANKKSTNLAGFDQTGDHAKYTQAYQELVKAGVSYTQKEIEAQETLVDTLKAQVTVQEKVAALKAAEKGNTRTATANAIGADEDAAFKRQVEAEKAEQDRSQQQWDENFKAALQKLQTSEREKIEATQQGSRVRLAAIDSAIEEEKVKGLEETAFYQQLLTQRVQLVRQMADDEARQKQEAGMEEARHLAAMGGLQVQADMQAAITRVALRRVTIEQMAQMAAEEANREYIVKMTAYSREIAALDAHAKDYENKLKQIQNRQEEETKAHENKITQIQNKAEQERTQREIGALRQLVEETSRGLASVLMRHQTFASMMAGIGDQIATQLLQNAIQDVMTLNMDRERTAAKAARKAFMWGWEHGGPAAPVLAPVLAAGAFAAVMAFEEGGLVPGHGNFDTVPAMLTPGEHVSDKKLTQGLQQMVDNGPRPAGHTVHYRPTFHVQTIDGTGVREMLEKHNKEFSRHLHSELRKLNQ